jgi:hypothetical protein
MPMPSTSNFKTIIVNDFNEVEAATLQLLKGKQPRDVTKEDDITLVRFVGCGV